MKLKVYSGLSISQKDVATILPDADFAPPIMRNDLAKDIAEGYHAVAIIDGKFDHYLAISPNEILDGLRSGMKIYGSSSMGAFRAVELDQFGMIGKGKVYEFIKSQPIFRDDFLGQLFFENGEVLTTTYIDFHFAGEKLIQERSVNPESVQVLRNLFQDLFYGDRTQETLIAKVKACPSLPATTEHYLEIAQAIFSLDWRQKNIDAQLLLNHIKSEFEDITTTNQKLANFELPAFVESFFTPIFYR